ncbi:HTH-type transcriptional repressor CytR [Anaerolineae bacterium]|nr:HTH-type transcriptional repressor CytR [Anaerolineae bacterium]
MGATLKDIAEKSGYSVTTVSRALSGYHDVNEQTRQHIIHIANALGYEPNLPARHLRGLSTQTIGMVIPANDQTFSAHDFFSQLLTGVGDAASRERYDLLISTQVPGEEEMSAYRRMVRGNRVDGMVLARTRQHDPRIAYLQEQGRPFVVSGRSAPGEPNDYPFIDVDSQAGLRILTEFLVGLGHRHIGLILPPEDIAYTDYRHNGYRDGLAQGGLEYRADYIVYGDLLRSGGYIGAQRLLDTYPLLTAIIACNDLMALGTMSAIQGRGLQVGRDVAVAGFDDIPAAEYAHPALTTIQQPIYEIGQRLVRMLLAIIRGEDLPESQILLQPKLVVRASSGPKIT